MHTISSVQKMKSAGEKIVCVTAYDATFASIANQANIEMILVGDSLGMVLQGANSTLPVTTADMAYHIRCTAAGNSNALILGDMSFMSYADPTSAMHNAAQLMAAGAHVVKLEGGQWLCPTISMLNERGIPVCAHLGLTPQSVNAFGGFKVQGRLPEQAQQIIEDALAVEAAGAAMLVLECIPSELGKIISEKLSIPTIGIGAGANTDGQVLVMHDLLGLNPRPAKFVRNFMDGSATILEAFEAYAKAVKDGSFPGAPHQFN